MSVLSHIEIPEGKHVLRILDNSGDSVITYDPTIDSEVAAAMAKFDESMAKGMRAFVLTEEGGGEAHVTSTLEDTAVHTVVQPQYVGG
jgi:hypothetical protein